MIADLISSNSKNGLSLKNAIVLILCMEWPLSVAQIYKRIIRGYGIDCSYQAVFKQVRELESTNVLVKEGRAYRINEEWLKSVNSFVTLVISKYKANPNGCLEVKAGDNVPRIEVYTSKRH
ncbi:MAG: hypothetical protein N3F05_03690 [Candidatus Diapherotrites archaeon]|nr:hypothetical protein [Candidatus Diapherotrites archaeon]